MSPNPSRKDLLILTFVFAVFCSSCAKKDSGLNNSDYTYPDYHYSPSLTVAQSMASTGTVDCSGTNCHDSVGMLATVHPEKVEYVWGLFTSQFPVGQCTAFAVSPTVIVTNAHCVPNDLRSTGANCENRIWVTFPKTANFAGQRAGCRQIMVTSTIDEVPGSPNFTGLPDYAFIELDRAIARTPLRLSQDGLADEAAVTIFKVNPISSDKLAGLMERKQCKALQRTLVIPSFDRADRPIVMLSGCNTIQGNSGSPVLDESGAVRAILHGTKLAAGKYPEFSIATNAACIPRSDGIHPISVSSECSIIPSSAEAKKSATPVIPAGEIEKLLATAEAQIAAWGTAHDDHFEWIGMPISLDSPVGMRLRNSEVAALDRRANDQTTLFYISAQTKCLKNPEKWLKRYKKWIGYKAKATVSVQAPILVMKGILNQNYRLGVGLSDTPATLPLEMRFSPASVADTGKTAAELWLKDLLYGDSLLGSGILETCKTAAKSSHSKPTP